ncbi:MAG: glycosyltransferase family 39 protein [Chloroflexota bacterium]
MTITLDRVREVKNTLKPKLKLNWNGEHLALGAILLLSAFLGLWNLSINDYSNNYYASAVRSMMQSWHNFFYASFDPGGFVTVDKPPVALWVQTAFAKVFGFNGVSLLLPEALAGIAGVFLLYWMVKRAFGTAAGLVSALVLAVTPIWVVMNRDNNPDSILVFTLILAAWAMLRAAEKGRLRWLMLAGLLVGVAFNVKMLEAYVVLPAFYLMYVLFARTSWRKRVLHLTITSLVIVAISLSWAVVVDLTPASQRPYVDSSSVNSELDLILNYNGLSRVEGQTSGIGEMPTPPTGIAIDNIQLPSGMGPMGQLPSNPGGPGGAGFGGQAGLTRLLVPQNAGEFNWFGPLALLGLVFLSLQTWFGKAKAALRTVNESDERSRRLQSIVLWGGWFLIYAVVFSFSKGTFHNYYLTIMAPAEAALAGSGLVMLWQRYRQGGWQAWLLPLGLAGTAFYQAYILTGFTSWNKWLSPVLIVVGLCALIGLVIGRFLKSEQLGDKLARGVVWTTMAALLITPAAWSVKAVFTSITGSIISAAPTGNGEVSSGNNTNTIQTWLDYIGNNLSGQLFVVIAVASAALVLLGLRYLLRQRQIFNLPTLAGVLLALFLMTSTGWWINVAQAQSTSSSASVSTNFPGNPGGGMGGNSQADQKLIQYLETNQADYKYLVAVSDSQTAAPIIIQTGKPVMSLGGFLGSDKIVTTTAQVEELIANHTVHYFMLGGGMGGGGGQQSSSVVTQYVQQNCTVVDSSLYSSSTSNSASGSQATSTDTADSRSMGGPGMTQQQQQLYVCK